MNMQEIRELAKDLGIKTSRLSKIKLIQSIQLTEGDFDCFSTAANSECDQLQCIWREDCFSAAKKAHG
jgi:hypothetical protein